MKIVADIAIPHLRECFAGLGDLSMVDGASMGRPEVRDADVLVVRTVTRVNAALLDGSRVRLVACASSGVDHVDTRYLDARGIALVDARGCNARAVAEYVLGSLCALSTESRFEPAGKRVGIIGFGHVGHAVRALLEPLGFRCLLNDPPLRGSGSRERLVDLNALYDVDILSLHVPLNVSGPHATRGLLGRELLSRLEPGATIINTARGEVVDETALLKLIHEGRGVRTVIDVWTGEPSFNAELMRAADLATPHVAGYSLEAKRLATLMVGQRVREFLQAPAGMEDLPAPAGPPREIDVDPDADDLHAIRAVILGCHDVRRDARSMSALGQLAPRERAAAFASLRAAYKLRREFSAHAVRVPRGRPALRRMLGALGFQVSGDG